MAAREGQATPRRAARLSDVAARAGVSPGLVSRLLNDDRTLTVRPETREAVLAAVRELDYVPNSSAASLRRSRTDAIALVLDRVTSPVFADVVYGAEEAAAQHGYGLLMADAEEAERDESFLMGIIKSRRVDGLLLQGGYGPRAAMLARYASAVPSVVVNSAGNGSASGVRLEDDAAARLATQHLIELGHRDIAFVTGTPGPASDARRRGYEDALASAGLASRSELTIPAGWQAEDGHHAVERYLRAHPDGRATGYVVGTSVAALGVLSALAAAGIRVPDDASVVGIHDPWFAPYLVPALTTVSLPLFELGRRSVEQLITHLRVGRPDEVVITDPPPLLVLRASTRPPERAAQ